MPAETQTNQPPTLKVCQMRVIWRDTFIVENAGAGFLDASLERLRALACYLSDSRLEPAEQPEFLRVIERVSRNVAPVGHPDLLRAQFAPIQIANLRPALDKLRKPPQHLTDHEMRDASLNADYAGAWISATPVLLLHRAGVGIMQYHVKVHAPAGLIPDDAIEIVRMGIHDEMVMLNDDWRCLLPEGAKDWEAGPVIEVEPHRHLLICGLRDLSRGVMAARLGMKLASPRRRRWLRFLRRREAMIDSLPPRPTGSASIVLIEVDPVPDVDFDAYCEDHAGALRGIGAMDTDWRNRADWLIRRELSDNLSTDAEMALYLLGRSELLLFNDRVGEAAAYNARRMRLADRANGELYFYAHYTALMEWVYLQEALLRWYLHRLDALIATPSPERRKVISTVQNALSDLVQYQEDITPYSTRVEFLQRAHEYRKLDTLAERFEKKQERLIDYASEYHDYREARAAEFLNWLAAILTGAALADLITTLAHITPDQTALYLGITVGCVALVAAIMTFLLRRV